MVSQKVSDFFEGNSTSRTFLSLMSTKPHPVWDLNFFQMVSLKVSNFFEGNSYTAYGLLLKHQLCMLSQEAGCFANFFALFHQRRQQIIAGFSVFPSIKSADFTNFRLVISMSQQGELVETETPYLILPVFQLYPDVADQSSHIYNMPGRLANFTKSSKHLVLQ